MRKKIISLLMASTMAMSMLAGCSSNGGNGENEPGEVDEVTPEEYYGVSDWEAKENVIDDNYRNYYQIFVYSFADSDGDGIGDINGITSKLDYLEELGINGIWLSPIHQSTTYHKYDVVDYYSIDKEYGTMEDFENFMAECEKRGIKVILDLVFNHTSAKHEWFLEATKYLRSLEAGQEPDVNECPYVGYYHFVKSEDAKSAYYKVTNSEYSYEGQFWDQMPDLDLASEAVRGEIEKIAKFWIDKGVGGFRLDAAKEFYTGATDKNVEVLKWFTDYIKSVDEDLYLVAEVWDTHATITKYYASGITSIFDYCYGNSQGYLMNAVNSAANSTDSGSSLAKRFVSTQNAYLEANPDMINAPFLSNHDCGRIAGFSQRKIEKIKMASALNLFMSGSSFTYYGEEIGMVGSGKDENLRAPMYWSEFAGAEGICSGPEAMDAITQEFESLDSQKDDTFSIYWYYRNAFHIKNMYPEIARGLVEAVEVEDGNVCAIKKTYNGETIYILFNLGSEETTVTLSKDAHSYEGLVAALEIDENKVTMEGETVKLPGYGVAVIK